MGSELVRIDGPHGPMLPAAAQVDLLRAWLAGLAGRKPTTIRAYSRDLADFAAFLEVAGPRDAVEVLVAGTAGQGDAAALAYRADLIGRGLSQATVGRRLAALRSVVKLARTVGRGAWALEMESPKSRALRDTAGPGDAGWRAMLDSAKSAAAGGSSLGVRNLAVVRMLHDLGLRRAELVGLDLADVEADLSAVSVVGKGRSERERLTLPDPVRKALGAWLDARGGDPGPLFTRLDPGARGPSRLTADGVYKLVVALGGRSGLPRRTRPHRLRHHAVTPS